jgi:ABC-type amino acid transport substrate-binding protein
LNRYAEDVDLARQLGCYAFRFSISWSRVEPSPGRYDDAAFEHYRQLIDAIRAAGMEPIVTLHHFTWPLHVEARGGMIASDFPDVFARYAQQVASRLGTAARYWITFNEPSQLVFGYIKPCWEEHYITPPGLPPGATLEEQVAAIEVLIRNLFLAHTAARAALKAANPEAQVGANPALLGLPAWLQRLVDWNATRQRSHDDLLRQGRRFAEGTLLARGEVDVVVATLTRTPERARQVAFSDAYFEAGQVLLVPAGSPVAGPADLAGRPVAVVKGSTAEQQIRALVPGASIRVVEDYATAGRLLADGQVEAVLADDVILRGLVQRDPARFKLVPEPLTREPYAAAVGLGDRELLDHVNAAVRRFAARARESDADGRIPPPASPAGETLAEISGSAIARAAMQRVVAGGPLPLAAPGTCLRRIQDRGRLIVAVKQDVPGFGERDPETGAYRGLDVDLAREIALQIFGDANRLELRPASTAERIPLLRSKLRFLDPILKPISVLSTILSSNWWHLGMAGKLPAFLCPAECIGQQDFVGFDYYWGIPALRLDRIQRLLDAAARRFDRAPVWPGALQGMLRYHADLFPGRPIMVVENGCVEEADGVSRAEYIRQHVLEIQRATHTKVPVVGYVCWAITSNREWGLPFGPASDFGLFHIELDHDPTLEHHWTPAAKTYQQLIAEPRPPAANTHPAAVT